MGDNQNKFNFHLKNNEQNEIGENTLLKESSLNSKKENLLLEKKSNLFQRIISICSYIWLIGILFICIFIFLATLEFKKKANLFNEVNDLKVIEILDVCKERIKVNKNISVYSGDTFKIPFIYGFLNPTIYLPKHILNEVNITNYYMYVYTR